MEIYRRLYVPRPTRCCIAFCAGFVLFVPGNSWSQPIPVGGEFRVNAVTASDQRDPQVAADADGNFVVVWADGGYGPTEPGLDGSYMGIVGQRYDRAGNAQGSAFVVNTDTVGLQAEPAVAMDADGDFVITWTDGLSYLGMGDGDGAGIAGRLFSSDGAPRGDAFRINAITAYEQRRSRVTMNRAGDFVVVWSNSFGNDGLRAQRFDSAGGPVGTELKVNSFGYNHQAYPDLEMADGGDFVVVWSRRSGDFEQDYDVWMRRFDSSGSALGPDLAVATDTTGRQLHASVALRGDGSFVVVWSGGSSPGIRGRAFDSAGAPQTGEFAVSTYSSLGSYQSAPRIAMDAADQFTSVWWSFEQDGDSYGVFGQQFDRAGNPLGSEFQINTYTTFVQGASFRGPDIAMDADGNYVVVWDDEGSFVSGGFAAGQDGDGHGVYAQRYAGTPSVDPDLIGHWPFDEGSGPLTANTGLANDGSLENGADFTPGQSSFGMAFDGADDLVRVLDDGADSPIDVTDALTIAFWARPDRIDGTTQAMVSKDNAYEVEFGKLAPDRWDLRLDNQLAALAPTPLEPQVWQHIAATWDGTGIRLYYNGLLDGGGPFAATLVPNDNDLAFGARPFGVGSVFPFEGTLDDVHIYNRVLDAAEIAQLVLDTLNDIAPPVRSSWMPDTSQPLGTTSVDLTLDTDEDAICHYSNIPGTSFDAMTQTFSTTGGVLHSSPVAVTDGQIYAFYVRCRDVLGNTNGDDVTITFGVGDSDLVSNLLTAWDFNEGTGCVAGDSVDGFDGVLGPNCPTNGPVWSTGHDGGTALTFDTDDDRVTVPNTPALATPTAITVATWLRHPGNLGFRSILDMRDSGTDGYDLYVDPMGKGFLRLNADTLTGNTAIGDGTWHHVVATYDGDALRLYVDGTLDTSSVIGSQAIDVSADLHIGRHFQTLNNTLGGDLSQVRMYGRALTDVEVLHLFLLTR